MNLATLPGPGDEATWPAYTGHPNDPRAPDDEGRDAAIDALVKSDYIDTDLLAEGGFVEDFIFDRLPAMPIALAKKLADASLGYKCQHSYGRSTSTDAACMAVGRVILDWLYDQAYEVAGQRVDEGNH